MSPRQLRSRHTVAVTLLAAAATPGLAVAQQTPPTVLPEFVVTASRVPVEAARSGSAITVISRAEIERRGDVTVSDLLRDVPGVAVNQSGPRGSVTQVRLRGAEGNHTLVLIDGIEVNDPATGSELDFGHLLTADIERIEVLRGPQSALWGSDAIGGVVNIVTRRGWGAPRVRAQLEGGSFGTFQGSASLSGGGADHDYAVTAAGIDTHGISVAPGSERATLRLEGVQEEWRLYALDT